MEVKGNHNFEFKNSHRMDILNPEQYKAAKERNSVEDMINMEFDKTWRLMKATELSLCNPKKKGVAEVKVKIEVMRGKLELLEKINDHIQLEKNKNISLPNFSNTTPSPQEISKKSKGPQL